MDSIIEQLGLDKTFFIELAIFTALFFFLANVYFKPFLRLFEARHKRTVQDRESAEKMMAEAQRKLEEYQERLAEERASARREFEALLSETKKEEAALIAKARDDAKKATQEALESVGAQRDLLRKQLEGDVEILARTISEKLLLRKE